MSDIETQLITGFAIGVAYLIALGAGCVILGILIDAGLEWWDHRHTPAPIPEPPTVRHIVAVAQPTREPVTIRRWDVPEDMYDLLEIDDPKREGLRCSQGMRVIHGGRKA